MKKSELFFTVFIAGMCTLALEFTASRLLQSIYGTSNIVWANVIGLTLLALSLGYFLGGRLADRHPHPHVFYRLISIAGATSIVLLLVSSWLLRSAASALAAFNVSAIIASLLGVIVAIGLPVTLLGCVSPFAIRLGVRDIKEAGRISGQIYAVSTAGSLLGTYLPVLITIPLAGTRLTAIIFGGLLLITGLVGWRRTSRPPTVIGLLLLLGGPILTLFLAFGDLKNTPGKIFETESAYNYVQVISADNCNYLLLNEGVGQHSVYCEEGALPRLEIWSYFLIAPILADNPEPERVAIVGLAAGTIAKQISAAYGPIPIDGIEIDGAIVQAGRDYFDMNDPNLNVIVGDGRYAFNQLDHTYDLVAIDAYRVPYIPWHLTTVEFFEEVQAKLTTDGSVAINVGSVPGDRRLIEALTATMLQVFPTVHTIDVNNSLNTLLVGLNESQLDGASELTSPSFTPPAAAPDLLNAILAEAERGFNPTVAGDVVFTDERAPVETIVDSLTIRYLLREGLGIFSTP